MKTCALCKEELLVYWDIEGEEICDLCFFKDKAEDDDQWKAL